MNECAWVGVRETEAQGGVGLLVSLTILPCHSGQILSHSD